MAQATKKTDKVAKKQTKKTPAKKSAPPSNRGDIDGLKYTLVGLTLMAVMTALTSIADQFVHISVLLWTNAAINLLAWAAVLYGMFLTSGKRIELRKGFLISIVGLAAKALSILLVFKQYKNGIGEAAFIDIYAMFMNYISQLAMLAIYYLLVIAMAQLLAKKGEKQLAMERIKVLKIGLIATAASIMLTPTVSVFPTIIAKILAVVVIIAGLLAQFIMIRYANEAYKKI